MQKFTSLSASLFFLITAGCGAQPADPQTVTQNVRGPVAKLSFDLFHNRIYVPVVVNSQTFNMVLDTGASMTGLSQESAQVLHLQTGGKAQLTGNGDRSLPITFAKNVTFHLEEAKLFEKSVAIIPFEDMEKHEGRPIQGVLGIDLFRQYVVVIDYIAKTLTLYDPRSFVYLGSGTIVPLHLKAAALLHASVSIPGHGSIPVDLAVDLGTYSALRLYTPFLRKHQWLGTQSPSIDSFDFGLGGEFPVKLGRVYALEIGGIKLSKPATIFPEAKGGATTSAQYDGTIGGAILSRFKITLDYPHEKMVLEPNSNLALPFRGDTSGLVLEARGPGIDSISVSHVLAHTPAAAAGIQPGDTIVRVDARDAQSLGLDGVRSLFRTPGAYHLNLRREDQNFDVNLRTDRQLF